MGVAALHIDSVATLTLSASMVIPVLDTAPTLTGFTPLAGPAAAVITLSDLKTFFEGGTANEFILTTGITTPSALTATTFLGFASTVSGGVLMGYGTTNDVSLMNRAGTVVLGIGPNTTAVNMVGTLLVSGTTFTLGAAGAARTVSGTTTALTSNVASGATTITGNVGTGTGAVGGFIFQVPITHGPDAVAQTLTTVLTLDATTAVRATFAGAVAINGALSGVTSATFSTSILSTTALATPSALAATQFTGFASTVSGAAIMGFGTTNDVALMNRAGTVVLGIGPNTTTVNLTGALTVVGLSTLGASAGTAGVVIDGTAFGAGVASLRFNGLTTAVTNNLVGTLTNSPVTGNPNFWMPVSIAGTIRYVPCF